LARPAYAATITRHLQSMSDVASDTLHRRVDLVARVKAAEETTLETYGDAVAMLVAVEVAQLELLQKCFGIDYHAARFSFGYSLGEIAALVAGDIIDPPNAVRVPLSVVDDCIELANSATLGILFTHSRELALDEIRRLCLEVNQEGRGVIGISSHLAPNTILIMGQADTLDRLYARARAELNVRVHLKKNDHRWPPMHTPIVWQRQIPDRTALQMFGLPLKLAQPKPRVFSLVTGSYGYTAVNAREILHQWVDHPQRLWDAVYETLASGVTSVIHIGPAPNIIPATFRRLSEGVTSQINDSRSLRALSAAVRRQWLRRLLPQRTALLRAPFIEHIILEDWLLDNAPK
jgi:[acyl-carrier-protein] S-malonyltransferase